MLPRVSAGDTVVVSTSRDAERMARLPARLVFHAQATSAVPDRVIADPSITVLTSWPATTAAIRQRAGRDPIEVGLAVDDVFFQAGATRVAGTIAFVPQASAARAARHGTALSHFTMVPIGDVDDRKAAAILQASEFYLAPEGDEACAPAILEALAAGCVVVRTSHADPALEVLDGVTGLVAGERDLGDVLRRWAAPAARSPLAAVRDRGRALAARHRVATLRRRVAELLAGPLAFVRS